MTRPSSSSAFAATLFCTTLALALGACAPTPEAATPPANPVTGTATARDAETPGACNAAPVQGLVGQQATEAVVAQATADSASANVRVLKPGDAATMDFRPDRLNILTDDAGVIEKIHCG